MMRLSTYDRLVTTLGIIWASPCTLVGLMAGGIGLISGGHVQRVGHTLEFWGGWITWQLNRIPVIGSAAAMTIGHVILGQDQTCLKECRAHEHVHVRQYERWGIFFFPAYLGSSLWLAAKGRDPYFDNPFEVEAYRQVPPFPTPESSTKNNNVE